jgi:RNA ligase
MDKISNRVVVDYNGEEKIVFLSTSINGEEQHWTTSLSIFNASGIKKEDIVKCEQHFSFGPDLYKSLKEQNIKNKEGFVLIFQPYFRMKIKFKEYVRLHRLLTNFSNVDIWESLMLGKDLSLMLEKVPDEFDSWVRNTIEELKMKFKVREDRAKEILDDTITGKNLTRKEIAEILNTQTSMNKAIIFCMLDGKDYSEIIWKNIRPVYQKPFWYKVDQN